MDHALLPKLVCMLKDMGQGSSRVYSDQGQLILHGQGAYDAMTYYTTYAYSSTIGTSLEGEEQFNDATSQRCAQYNYSCE